MNTQKTFASLIACLGLLAGCRTIKTDTPSITSAPTVDSATGIVDIFPGEDTIPIMSWHCIVPDELTIEHYQELKECGFNISFPHTYSLESAKKALDCAAATGLRVMMMCPELDKNPEAVVPQVMNHPGLAGYHLRDEPSPGDIPELKERNKRIRAIDPIHFTYMNLLPKCDFMRTYEEYVDFCFTEVDTPFLSYDHYGISYNGVGALYYMHLETFLQESRRLNKPFWAFALATAHAHYPIPNKAQLKFQMYSNLAYGAQGLQYFTYWCPSGTQWDFHKAPVEANGKRTAVYDFVREVNQELQNRNFVFMRSKVEFVRHTGKELPVATTRLAAEDLPDWVAKIDTHDRDAVVSLLSKGDKRYLAIVNASIVDVMDLDITLAPGVMRIRKDGTIVPADEYEESYILGPGECEVFAFDVCQ